MPLDDRHSKALEPELISDPDQKAHQEAKNGLRQFDKAIEIIESSLDPERPFKLRPSAIMGLNRIALDGLSSFAGNYRPADIEIGASKHIPPKAYLVPELVEEMCDHVNNNWDRSPIYLAAYVLWRLNWIHAFVDGNGRGLPPSLFFARGLGIEFQVRPRFQNKYLETNPHTTKHLNSPMRPIRKTRT